MKTTNVNGVEISASALKHGVVRTGETRLGRIREAGVGKFVALDAAANVIGEFRTKVGAAEAVLTAAAVAA